MNSFIDVSTPGDPYFLFFAKDIRGQVYRISGNQNDTLEQIKNKILGTIGKNGEVHLYSSGRELMEFNWIQFSEMSDITLIFKEKS